MTEEHIQARLVHLLKQDKVQLWNPPYTGDTGQPGHAHLQELAERYAALTGFSVPTVLALLERVRAQAVRRGRGNATFRETRMASLELLLPRGRTTDAKEKNYLETKLDVPAQDVMNRIAEEYGLKHIKLILNGKTLAPERRLDEQNVRNNSRVMVLRVSEPDRSRQTREEAELRTQEHSLQRTQRGFQILSERDGGDDPETTPFLEIADQKGNPLKIPSSDKKALIVAMGFHEKGRALMKRKQYDAAVCHLLQADEQFGGCGSVLLSSVDNYAVLQLDIVWCYRALEALCCLDDGRQRLQRAEEGFLRCYGQQQERLMKIQGNAGREEVLFLRLYLLQSLLAYLDGDDRQAALKLLQVEELYRRLVVDPGQMTELLTLGFSEQEARLGLRACHGNLNQAALHIAGRRQEREALRASERERRRRCVEGAVALRGLGFSRREAARALHQADGDLDQAYGILLDSAQAAASTNNNAGEAEPVSQHLVDQLMYLGFERAVAAAALRLTGGEVAGATQLLLDYGGVLPPELLSPSPPSPRAAQPSTSAGTAGPRRGEEVKERREEEEEVTERREVEEVTEVLEDLSRHEEDYLDITLEEEGSVIAMMKSYLHSHAPNT